MFIGNQEVQSVLENIFKGMQDEQRVSIPFLLLSGQPHLGKTSMLLKQIQDLLGEYVKQDFLYFQDFSEQLEKPHALKISQSSGEMADTLRKEYGYDDLGVRELREWLAKSPSGDRKIVLLENIERMTISAANALLKSCEEPLPGRLIVATTSDMGRVLPTLISRAFLLRCHRVDDAEIEALLQERFASLTAQQIHGIVHLSMGRPGLALSFAERMSDGIQGVALLEHWTTWQSLADREQGITERFQLLKKIDTDGDVSSFLDVLLVDAIGRQDVTLSDLIISTKKMLSAHVQKEALLLQLAMG